jgi:signal transduction histidine kinase/CheY-like chemotaxis protein
MLKSIVMRCRNSLIKLKQGAKVLIGGITHYAEVISGRRNRGLVPEKSETRLNKIFNSVPVIMILINNKLQILKINNFGYYTLGISGSDIEGLKFDDLLICLNPVKDPGGSGNIDSCKNCNLRSIIDDTFATGEEFFRIEADIVFSSDNQKKKRTFLVSTSVISDDDEKKVFVTLDEITSYKELESELERAKRKAEENDKLKRAFLSNISHEIRTPMNGIMGFAELLTEPNLSDEKRHQYSSLLSDGCRQLLGILTDVIYIAHIEADQITVSRSEVNLNDLINDLYLSFITTADNKKINLVKKKSLADNYALISTDSEKLNQVFNNLLTNAFKFTEQGYIEFGYNYTGTDIEFFVKDTGIGISNDLHSVIFDRFIQADTSSTRSFGGVGLGLTISKALVELLGGKIWLESEPGNGSSFFFNVPYKSINGAVLPPYTGFAESKTSSENIVLIAEDNDLNYYFLEQVLLNLNYTPCCAKNGYEAVHMINSNPGIKLVLMDIKMPVMDGYEATREIKKIRPSIPIIAQTAYAIPVLTDKMKMYGFDDVITKPIDTEKLERMLNYHMKIVQQVYS